ncbi:MAG: 23S rRNA (guanosine(2251)-2'-O)-methyltransferase RlmB [Bacteroidales bacterium]|nr:23S rRNA (guanosine(2251)-2'-O)-methyltransferase RlmB [Bacteroidales bacterium]
MNDNIVYGIRAIIEAINAGREVDKVLLKTGISGELLTELRTAIKDHQIPFQYVPIQKLNNITRKTHQGAIAFLAAVEFQNIEEVLANVYESGKTPFILVLDKVSDVRNFGAISRSAECAGVDAIVIPAKGSAAINADAVKTSAGALHRIPVCRSNMLKDTIDYLKEYGLKVVACTEKTSNIYNEFDYTVPVAIIMGSEDKGISHEYLNRADFHARIPMVGSIGSLNVSVAAGIILYEGLKQRGFKL